MCSHKKHLHLGALDVLKDSKMTGGLNSGAADDSVASNMALWYRASACACAQLSMFHSHTTPSPSGPRSPKAIFLNLLMAP